MLMLMLMHMSVGMALVLVGHPFDTLKVRIQTEGKHGRFNGPIHCARQVTHSTHTLRGCATADSIVDFVIVTC